MNIARLKNTKAFTLIELIVVIVILGILVAIGAFAYQSLIKSSRISAVEKTGNQIAKSIAAASASAGKSPSELTATQVTEAVSGDVTVVATRGTGEQAVLPATPTTGATLTYYNAAGCSVAVPLTATKVGAAPTLGTATCPN